ncbi:MAG: HAD family hydrolase [Ruminococcus sp.]|nr:HAD family hydrolase [Ruminococcus sp.]
MKTLYACDLDGTLLRSDKTISDFTRETINTFVEHGGCFCYASARSYITAKAVTKGLDCPFPAISYNGTFVRDNKDDRMLIKNTFDQSTARSIIKAAAERGVYPVVYSLTDDREKYFYIPDKLSEEHMRFQNSRKGDIRDTPVDTVEGLMQGEIYYLSFIDSPKRLLPLYDIFKSMCRCLYQRDTYEDYQWLELMPEGATKANAVKAVAQMLGCERIVSFGDGINDIDMFKISDLSLAVANGEPEAKNTADQVIASNDEDGVAKWLEKVMRCGMANYLACT